MVQQEASVTERDLNNLDRGINALVQASRGGQKLPSPAQAAPSIKSAAEDVRSQVSKKSFARSRSEVSYLDVDQQIITGNQGKVIGMTSAEWNDTVQKNVVQWTSQMRDKAQRLQIQREQMRSELQHQMAVKSAKESTLKHFDRSKH